MSGKTIGTSLNHGFAGNYARMPDMVIGTLCIHDESSDVLFGDAVFLKDGAGTAFQENLTAADFVGVAVSEIKSAFTFGSMEGLYKPGQAASVIKRGAVSVICQEGEPVAGRPAYLRVAVNESLPDAKVGGFEAAADGDNTLLLPNAVWASGSDSNHVAELLLRNVNLI